METSGNPHAPAALPSGKYSPGFQPSVSTPLLRSERRLLKYFASRNIFHKKERSMDVDSKIHKIEYQMAHCYGNCKIYEVSQISTFLRISLFKITC